MRNLQTTDVFSAFRLLNKIGVREKIREVAIQAEESKGKKVKIDYGFDLLFGILEKAAQKNAENEIYVFIADLLECQPEEVAKMNYFTLNLKQNAEKISESLLNKHFFRKHGKNSYYGQK